MVTVCCCRPLVAKAPMICDRDFIRLFLRDKCNHGRHMRPLSLGAKATMVSVCDICPKRDKGVHDKPIYL